MSEEGTADHSWGLCVGSEGCKERNNAQEGEGTRLEGMAEGFRVFLLQKTWRGMNGGL